MMSFTRWSARLERKAERRKRLDDAMIADGGPGYAGYRLKYLSIRMFFKAALHLAEMTLFARVFETDFLAGVILLRGATMFAGSFWWGWLEQLRNSVREHSFSRTLHQITDCIEKWMGLSICFSVVTIGIGIWLILANTHETWGFSIYNAYAIACLVRFGLDVVGRTYHSGMFAVSRVYRPLWSVLLGDVLDVLMVLVLWRWLGVWSFSVAFLFVGFVRFFLLLHFVRRAYRNKSWPVVRLQRMFTALRRFSRAELKAGALAGAANSAGQMDTIFIMALAVTARTTHMMDLAIAMYILRPFIGAGYSWSRLFYFDLKLLWWRNSLFLRARFERYLKKVAFIFSLAVGTACVLWCGWLGSAGLQMAGVLFLPLLISRSYLGLYQLIGFSYEQYRYVFLITGVAGLSFFLLLWVIETPFLLLLLLALSFAVIAVGFPPAIKETRTTQGEREQMVNLPCLLARLASREGPSVQVAVLTVNTDVVSIAKVAVSLAANPSIESIARLSAHRLCVVTTDDWTPVRWAMSGGGAITDIQLKNAPVADASLLQWLGCAEPCAAALVSGDGAAVQALLLQTVERFTAQFPDGKMLSKTAGMLRRDQLTGRALTKVVSLLRMSRQVNWKGGVRIGSGRLTAFVPGGEPQIVFWLPDGGDDALRQEWLETLYGVTLSASLSPMTRFFSKHLHNEAK